MSPRSVDPLTAEQVKTQNRLSDLATTLRGSVAKDDSQFLTFAIDAHASTLTVYRTGDRSTVAENAYTRKAPPDLHVVFARALLSTRQADQLHALVKTRRGWLEANGVDVVACGVDGGPGPFKIWHSSTAEPDHTIVEPFLLFGPDTVRLENLPEPFNYQDNFWRDAQ